MRRMQVPIADIMLELEAKNLLPAIVFRSARNNCDLDAEFAARNRRLLLPREDQDKIKEEVRRIVSSYDIDPDLVTTHPQYNSLVQTAVGAHHAGQLLIWRLLLEELMSAGLLRVLVATGTVAAGVDFPARSVVITAHAKRGSDGFRVLASSEFQQMSGRAGRRGKDAVGFCFAAPSDYCDARSLHRIAKQPPEPLKSAYFPSPSTVLNLLRYRNVDGLRFAVEKSLAAYLDRQEARKIREQAKLGIEFLPEEDLNKYLNIVTTQEEDDSDSEAGFSLGNNFSKDQKKTLKRVRRSFRHAAELDNKQTISLNAALTGLTSLGYINQEHLSEKGHWASNLCSSLVLELSEVIQEGLLENASSETLITIISSISADSHRPYLPTKTLLLSKEQEAKLENILEKIYSVFLPGTFEQKQVNQSAAFTALTWVRTPSWQEFRSLLIFTGVAEGDAARLITQTAEQLNQISRLEKSHPQLAKKAEEAKRLLLRPPLTEAINFDT